MKKIYFLIFTTMLLLSVLIDKSNSNRVASSSSTPELTSVDYSYLGYISNLNKIGVDTSQLDSKYSREGFEKYSKKYCVSVSKINPTSNKEIEVSLTLLNLDMDKPSPPIIIPLLAREAISAYCPQYSKTMDVYMATSGYQEKYLGDTAFFFSLGEREMKRAYNDYKQVAISKSLKPSNMTEFTTLSTALCSTISKAEAKRSHYALGEYFRSFGGSSKSIIAVQIAGVNSYCPYHLNLVFDLIDSSTKQYYRPPGLI